MNRRNFLVAMAAVTGTGVSWLLASCGSTAAPACTTGTGQVTYTNPGHSHSVTNLTAAQVTAAAAGNYTVMGGNHTHFVALAAGDFTTLASGGTVTKTSDTDGHTITIKTC